MNEGNCGLHYHIGLNLKCDWLGNPIDPEKVIYVIEVDDQNEL